MAICYPCSSCPVSKPTSLAGKVAVVTGASSGIGRAIAVALAAEGVKVAMGARRLDLLEETVKGIKEKGGQAISVKTDVVDRQQVKGFVAEAEKAFGPVDFLINNAGCFPLTMMKNLMEDEWERTIDVNCKGVMNGIGAVLGGMVERRSGHIVTISSENGRFSSPSLAVYCGTKFFVDGMAQALRREVAGYGIRVTNIQPGWVDTEGTRYSCDKEADQFNTSGQMVILKDTDIANSVIYALTQPPNVCVGELLVQPLEQLQLKT